MDLNGKRFICQPASFEAAMELQDAFAESLKGSKLDLSGLSADSVKDLLSLDVSQLSGLIEGILGMGLSAVSSKRLRAAFFECCATVLVGDDKVDRAFFEKVENRELYYPIMVEVVKVNLGPFIKRLASLFGGQGNLLQGFLKSKST